MAKKPKIQEIKLKCGIEVIVDWNSKKKCKCGKEIYFAKTEKGRTMPIVLVGLAEWDIHFVDCPFAKKFRKNKPPRQRTMKVKEIKDLGLVAALITLKIHPKSKRLQGKKAVFVFETNKEFELLCKDYFSKTMIGDFYSYNEALRKVKSSIYQMRIKDEKD